MSSKVLVPVVGLNTQSILLLQWSQSSSVLDMREALLQSLGVGLKRSPFSKPGRGDTTRLEVEKSLGLQPQYFFERLAHVFRCRFVAENECEIVHGSRDRATGAPVPSPGAAGETRRPRPRARDGKPMGCDRESRRGGEGRRRRSRGPHAAPSPTLRRRARRPLPWTGSSGTRIASSCGRSLSTAARGIGRRRPGGCATALRRRRRGLREGGARRERVRPG